MSVECNNLKKKYLQKKYTDAQEFKKKKTYLLIKRNKKT